MDEARIPERSDNREEADPSVDGAVQRDERARESDPGERERTESTDEDPTIDRRTAFGPMLGLAALPLALGHAEISALVAAIVTPPPQIKPPPKVPLPPVPIPGENGCGLLMTFSAGGDCQDGNGFTCSKGGSTQGFHCEGGVFDDFECGDSPEGSPTFDCTDTFHCTFSFDGEDCPTDFCCPQVYGDTDRGGPVGTAKC